MASFDLSLQTRTSLLVDGEPSDFIAEYHGEVLCIDDETGEETVAGHIHALRLQADMAADHGESLFDVCDSHSQTMHKLHTLLYEPGKREFREPLVKRFEIFDSDLLVLDHILLDPKWRGLKIGLLVARKIIDLLGSGCGLIVSEIAPLLRSTHKYLEVPAKWIPKPRTKDARKDAVVGLRSYFRQMGFKRIGRSGYYALSNTLKTPIAKDLLRPGTAKDE